MQKVRPLNALVFPEAPIEGKEGEQHAEDLGLMDALMAGNRTPIRLAEPGHRFAAFPMKVLQLHSFPMRERFDEPAQHIRSLVVLQLWS